MKKILELMVAGRRRAKVAQAVKAEKKVDEKAASLSCLGDEESKRFSPHLLNDLLTVMKLADDGVVGLGGTKTNFSGVAFSTFLQCYRKYLPLPNPSPPLFEFQAPEMDQLIPQKPKLTMSIVVPLALTKKDIQNIIYLKVAGPDGQTYKVPVPTRMNPGEVFQCEVDPITPIPNWLKITVPDTLTLKDLQHAFAANEATLATDIGGQKFNIPIPRHVVPGEIFPWRFDLNCRQKIRATLTCPETLGEWWWS